MDINLAGNLGNLGQWLFEESHIGLVITDMTGQFVKTSTEFAGMLGYTPQELQTMHIGQVSHRADVALEREHLQNLLHGRTETLQMEKRFIRKNGRLVWALIRLSTLYNQADKRTYIIGQVQDITHQKRLEHQLKYTMAQLDEALHDITLLEGLLPICAYCKRIRDEAGHWYSIEAYIAGQMDVEFSHGICPTCMDENFPNLRETP